MRTIHTFTTSAVAVLGLVSFGMTSHSFAAGKEMGHGPVVNASGTIGKEPVKGNCDRGCYWDKDWFKSYSYLCGYPTYCFPTENCWCNPPVCEAPYYFNPVVLPTTCFEPIFGYETYRCYDGCYPTHHKGPVVSKPTTASSLRNTENLGRMAQHISSGHGHR